LRKCLTSEYFIILPGPYYSFVPSFSHVFWIDASSIGTITQGLRGICNLPEAQSSALDGSPQSALWWISSMRENYAMIFDNADNLTPEELEQYVPSGLGGNILITSRNSGLKHLTLHDSSLEVKEMEENDAISLLLKAACLDESQEDLQSEACKIVNELFCIPLAIDQAGAFIAFGDTDIRDYLDEYSQYRERLLSYPAFKGASRYNRSVYGTWELSFEEIQQRAKSKDSQRAEAANSAMFLLAIFAFFHFNGITEEIFSYAATQEHEKNEDKEQRSALPLASSIIDCTLLQFHNTGKWDNFIFKEGLRVLLSFSLIKPASSKGIYTMHPLIHAWVRERMSSEDRQKYCLMAYVMLAGSLSEYFDGQPYQFRRILVTHLRANIMQSVMERREMDDRYFDDAHQKFGRMLSEQGYHSEAEKFQIQVLGARSRTHGEEHPGTISAMGDLAITYMNLGKYADAEKLQIKVLNRYLGEEHLNTFWAMGNLASTYESLGKYADAEKVQIQALDMGNRLLGEEHPDTIRVMNNLAIAHQSLGKYADAEKLQIEVLNVRNRLLGEEHPDTIRAMSNLAITYQDLGKYADAEKLQIQVLDMRNRLLGEEHPDTIGAMNNFAVTYLNLGKYADAEKLQIQALEMGNRLFGEEHPDTISGMNNLAVTYQKLGKYADAEKLQIQVLDMRNRLLGEEHPDTIGAMENLAITFYNLQKYSDAERLVVQVVDLRGKSFGGGHPKTVKAVALLESIRSQAITNI
jgi:tetratricopeptide (TPR) repeat protein